MSHPTVPELNYETVETLISACNDTGDTRILAIEEHEPDYCIVTVSRETRQGVRLYTNDTTRGGVSFKDARTALRQEVSDLMDGGFTDFMRVNVAGSPNERLVIAVRIDPEASAKPSRAQLRAEKQARLSVWDIDTGLGWMSSFARAA